MQLWSAASKVKVEYEEIWSVTFPQLQIREYSTHTWLFTKRTNLFFWLSITIVHYDGGWWKIRWQRRQREHERDGPLENLWRGGGGAKYKQNLRARENEIKKKNKQISARQLTLKIFMLWPKRNSYKECDNEKNSWGSNIPHLPPPPITFLMVRPKKATGLTHSILEILPENAFWS